ncbi:PiggyBac transposase Uribo2 [Elysia marginata]|uniref:PiggyBac transposase Uribo2 n=1 Tax=Elysia marginata TaxID=1093978 RepID=A0AAV4FDW3_9GAST|nr:PiggyBac transposase Uribo2 [Elysia marginata]
MCTSTAKANRVLKQLKNTCVPKGETAAFSKGPVLAQKFGDKRSVHMLTTGNDNSTIEKQRPGGQRRTIPTSIDDYNKNMGGMDRIEPYDATRKTVRWYVKLAIHLIQIAVLNGWTLYKDRGGKNDFLKFTRNVIANLVFRDGVVVTEDNEDLARLTGRHFIYELPPSANKLRPQKRCRVCFKRGQRRDTRFHCPTCPSPPGLCLGECFKLYHTKEAYWE